MGTNNADYVPNRDLQHKGPAPAPEPEPVVVEPKQTQKKEKGKTDARNDKTRSDRSRTR